MRYRSCCLESFLEFWELLGRFAWHGFFKTFWKSSRDLLNSFAIALTIHFSVKGNYLTRSISDSISLRGILLYDELMIVAK